MEETGVIVRWEVRFLEEKHISVYRLVVLKSCPSLSWGVKTLHIMGDKFKWVFSAGLYHGAQRKSKNNLPSPASESAIVSRAPKGGQPRFQVQEVVKAAEDQEKEREKGKRARRGAEKTKE